MIFLVLSINNIIRIVTPTICKIIKNPNYFQYFTCNTFGVERKLLSINYLAKFRVMETATLKIAKSLSLCDLRTTQNVSS